MEKTEKPLQRAALVFRLSSLGDVILSLAVLESSNLSSRPVDWVVAKEFASLIQNDPRVRNVFVFDRKQGLRAWIHFVQQILQNGSYGDVYDLHGSLRTVIAKGIYFRMRLSGLIQKLQWRKISKDRLRLWMFYILKNVTPQFLKPQSKIQSYLDVVGGAGHERPSLKGNWRLPSDVTEKKFWVIMPSSAWEGKEWPVENYFRLIQDTGIFPIVLGTLQDKKSAELVSLLRGEAIQHQSGVAKWSLTEVFAVIQKSEGFIGVDTGLAHAAEALGKPAMIVYGPTHPAMGFGPWREGSYAFLSNVSCRPCGKDGRYCIRLDRYRCMKKMGADRIVERLTHENQNL